MKKILTLALAVTLVISMAACTGNTPAASTPQAGNASVAPSSAPAPAGGGIDIGYCVPDTTNPFVGWLTGEVKTRAEADGLTVQVADAANSATKQLEQIENFVAMKVKAIALMPVDPNNVQEAIQKAQAAGIKVMVAGTDTGAYDVMMNMNQYNCGEQIAEMGIDWLLKTFSSDGSTAGLGSKPKVLVIKYTGTIDATNRCNGIIEAITNWGFADVVVAQGESITSAEATSVMENMWQQNSDATLIFTYNADSALGVNEYIMGQAGIDKSKIAVFSGDSSDPIIEVVNASKDNNSVFRGTMSIVGPRIDNEQVPLPDATYQILKGLADGSWDKGNIIEDAISKTLPQ